MGPIGIHFNFQITQKGYNILNNTQMVGVVISICIILFMGIKIGEMNTTYVYEEKTKNDSFQNQIDILKTIIKDKDEIIENLSIKNKEYILLISKLEESIIQKNQFVDEIDLYSIHKLEVTAYTNSPDETNGDLENTAIMNIPTSGKTVAVSHDLKHWLGKWVYIETIGIRKVEDLMNPDFERRMDILVPSKELAVKHGVKQLNVVLLGERS